MCVVLVHFPGESNEAFYFRFIDQTLAASLAAFLESDNKDLTLGLSELLIEAEFPHKLKEATAPGFVEGVTTALATAAIQRVLPNTRLEIHRDASGSLTLVTLQRFGDHFEIKDESTKLQFHNAIFGLRERMIERLSRFDLKPAIASPLKHLPSPIAFLGPLTGQELNLLVRNGDRVTTLKCEVRMTDDYTGVVHPSGFALTFSKAMPEGDVYVHHINAEIDLESKAELTAYPDLWAFLEACQPEASVEFAQLVLPVENVGDLLTAGFFARYLRQAYPLHDWPDGTWLLPDLLAEETLNTLAFLIQLNVAEEWLEGQGFANENRSDSGFEEEPVDLVVPVCANLPRQGLIVWLEMEGSLFLDEDRSPGGIRLGKTRNQRIELRSKRFAMSCLPEVVLKPDWPTMRFSPDALTLGDPPKDWECEAKITLRTI
jgi:hypothetical protein